MEQVSVPTTADVVIVGGGIMGASTAFFLTSETDLETVLVEKGTIASGSTGDSSAILRHHYGPQKEYTKMAWWSHQFYQTFEAETGSPMAYEANPLVRTGTNGTPSGEYVKEGAAVLAELDIPTTEYDPEEFREAYPMMNFEDFDFAVSDDTAAYADGFDAANGLARAARERGATIITDTEVTDIKSEGGTVTQVDTTAGSIACEAAVLTAGPWTAELATAVGVDIPLEPSREQVVILERPEEYDAAYADLPPMTALPGGEVYLRPDFGDGILIATHHWGEPADPDAYDDNPDEEVLLELTEQVMDVIPELTEGGIKGQYCGIYTNTPDRDFIIDQVGPSGCYIACGFSGHGFKHGPAVGKVLKDLVTDGKTELVDIDFFSLSRFDDDPAGHGLPEDSA